MRYILTSIILLQALSLTGQKINNDLAFPFHVLYAENAKNNMGQSVKSLDRISFEDVLTVEKGGTLSLIHYSGFPVEISNDTILVIKDLQNAIVPATKKKRKRNFPSTLVGSRIEYLFISNPVIGRKEKLQMTGACMDCNFDFEILYPPKFDEQPFYYFGNLCVKWRATDSSRYKVQMLNTSSHSYATTRNEVTIENPISDEDLVFMIIDSKTGLNSSAYVFKPFLQKSLEYPYPCEIKKASFALLAGLYLELSPRDYFKDAEKYFVLATELSDRKFYRDMLENFRKRREW